MSNAQEVVASSGRHGLPDRALAGAERQRPGVGEILRRYGAAYREAHALPAETLEVMSALERCRTRALGGNVRKCDRCGHREVHYNSCGNRHCPTCRAIGKARWLEARRAELLPIPYFHAVFTVPHELNVYFRFNRTALLTLLFAAVSQTLLDFGRNNLGGQLGIVAALHTWDQKLNAHFHAHCLVTGGAWSEDREQWIECREGYLFPVTALGEVYRGKFLSGLKKLHRDGKLILPDPSGAVAPERRFKDVLDCLYRTAWNVYLKHTFPGGAEKTLDYFGRSTQSMAISNGRIVSVEHGPEAPTAEEALDYFARYSRGMGITNERIVSIDDGSVTFRYWDRAAGYAPRLMTLPAEEFIRRLMLHVLPKGFVRMRHYGFLANRYRRRNLARIRKILDDSASPTSPASSPAPVPPAPGSPPAPASIPDRRKSAQQLYHELTGQDPTLCPRCRQGRMRIVEQVPRPRRTRPTPGRSGSGVSDSS